MQLLKVGQLTNAKKFNKTAAIFLIVALFFFQISSGFAWTENDFRVISGGYESFSCDASGNCTFNGLQDGTIIEWLNGFSIAAGTSMSFLFGNIGSVMNRDISGNISNILGNLFSNGTVFLINPAGINIGASAMIDVGSLVASSLNISNENFLAGNYTFENGAQAGMVFNEGTITVQPGGFAALLGSSVHNAGQIIAQMGSVALAVGETITLTFDPNGLINVAIPQPLAERINNESEVAIANSGLIRADGGKVILRAETIQNLFNQLINNSGIIEANSVAVRNGVVELIANGGSVENSGTIRANGTVENSNGGTIYMRGDDIHMRGLLQANALDYGVAGNLDVVALYDLWLHTGSVSEARGHGAVSHGGNIYMYAYRNGYFEEGATIDLSGGELGGNGGSGEFSAREILEIGGNVLNDIVEGYQLGNFLFDPTDIVFSGNTICGGTCVYQADRHITFNANATVTASNGGLHFIADYNNDGVGNITMNANSSATARDFIYFDGGATASLRNLTTTGIGSTIKIGMNHPFGRLLSNITLNGILSAAGNIMIDATNDITINQNVTSTSGDVTMNARRNITIGTNRTVKGNNVSLTADSENNLIGNFTMNSGSSVLTNGNGAINIKGAGSITLRTLNANGGSITVQSTNGSISDDNNNATLLTADQVTLTAKNGIGATGANGQIDLSTNFLTATASNGSIFAANNKALTVNNASSVNGSITITAAGTLTANNVSATGTGTNTISLTASSGDLIVGSLTADNAITLTSSAGNIFDDGNALTQITINSASLLSMNAFGSIGTLLNPIQINNASGHLSNLTANQDLFASFASGNINFSSYSVAGLQATLGTSVGTLKYGTGSNLGLTARNGNITNSGNVTLQGNEISLSGTSIGTLLQNVKTNANSLRLNSTTGDIFVTESNGATVNASSTSGNINVTTTTGDLSVGTVSTSGNITLRALAGNLLSASSSVVGNIVTLIGNAIGANGNTINTNAATVNTTASGSGETWITDSNGATFNATAGTGDIHLTTTTGDLSIGTITTAGNAFLTALSGNLISQASSITANAVTLIGNAIGSSLARINTNANTIIATANNGSIYMTEANGAFLSANSSAANGTIDVVSTTGDLTLGDVNAGTGAVLLEATTGNILDGNGAANNITAGSNSSLNAAGTIGTTLDGIDVNVTNGATLTVRASSQDGSGTSINLDGSINGEVIEPGASLDYGLDNDQTPPGFVIFNGNVLFPTETTPAVFSPIIGPVAVNLTELISPLFTQDYTRRKPAVLAQ